MKKIILLGYMGCGKSTIAQKLTQKIDLPYLDLDEWIEKKTNSSIKKIFEQYGEVYFRKLEHEAFKEILETPNPLILGLGGGTPCYANNHELLQRDDVVSVYLKASVDTLYQRLSKNKAKRPLIAHLEDEELKEFIAKHLFDRSFYYNHAQYKVEVDQLSIEETVDAIAALLA